MVCFGFEPCLRQLILFLRNRVSRDHTLWSFRAEGREPCGGGEGRREERGRPGEGREEERNQEMKGAEKKWRGKSKYRLTNNIVEVNY